MKISVTLSSRRLLPALIAMLVATSATAETPLDPPVKPTVSGNFVGNGKNAAIKFVMVEEREPFSDKEAIKLIFTEKDPSKAERPSWDASFGKLGSALVLSVHHDGGIFGCEVSHEAHQKRGFSSLGQIEMKDFKIEKGNVTGRVSTGKELDTFGEKWDVDLTFAAPLPEKLRNAPAATPKSVAVEPVEEPAKKEPKTASGPLLAARKLPLPKDAANVEFKTAVKQIHLTSARPVEPVAKEFAANLKQQGWKDTAGSLMGKQNAILRREQGEAKLTIMVQPAPAGCTVKVFAEGMDWSGADETPAKTAPKTPSVDDIEAQTQKLLKEAMKDLPAGF